MTTIIFVINFMNISRIESYIIKTDIINTTFKKKDNLLEVSCKAPIKAFVTFEYPPRAPLFLP